MREWLKTRTALDHRLHEAFFRLGVWVARNPWLTIGACLVFTFTCTLGFLNFEVENEPERLYTPQGSEVFGYRDYVESLWGFGLRFNSLILVSSRSGAALTRTSLVRLLDVYDATVAHTVEYDGEAITFGGLCQRIADTCATDSVLALWNYNRTTIAGLSDDDILVAVNQPPLYSNTGLEMSVSDVVGGIQRDESGNIVAADALRLSFRFVNNLEEQDGSMVDPRARKWEIGLMDAVEGWSGLYVLTEGGFSEAAGGAISADVLLIPFGYVLMICYAALVLARRHPVKSQACLALASVLAVCLSTLAAFGVVSSFTTFSTMVQAAIVLLLGIGIDDTFVIINSLRLTDPGQDDAERIGHALSDAGSAITVTSLTDFFAFIAGSYSSLPAIHVFCVYSAFGVLFDYLYQVTFFVACVALDLRRQKRSRVDCFSCLRCYDGPAGPRDCLDRDRAFDEKGRGAVTAFVCRVLADTVLSPVGRVLTLLVGAGLLAVGAYGATRLRTDFNIEWFIPEGTDVSDALRIRDKYFESGDSLTQWVYFRDGDYYQHQDDLVVVSEGLPSIRHFLSGSVVDWHAGFRSWLESDASGHANGTLSDATFVPWLEEFLQSAEGSVFANQLKLDNGRILGSRIEFATRIETANDGVDSMRDGRHVVGEASTALRPFLYNLAHVFFDGLVVMQEELVRNLLLAGGAVFLVCTLLLSDVRLGLLMVALLAVIDVEILGFAYFVGLTYNSVTVFNCLVAVGLAVDYTVHVAHSFMCAQGTRVERATCAVHHIGGAVVSGGVSTMLAVSVLAFASSYVFTTFFKMLAFMICDSLFHGVCVLPALLSWVGPAPYLVEKDRKGGLTPS